MKYLINLILIYQKYYYYLIKYYYFIIIQFNYIFYQFLNENLIIMS